MCGMTLSYVWHNAFICVTWLIKYTCDLTHLYAWHDAFTWATWLIHMCQCNMTWHDPFTCVTWLVHFDTGVHTCDIIHSYVWDDSFICVTWHIHMCDTTNSYVRHDWFIYMTYSFKYVIWCLHICQWIDVLMHLTRVVCIREIILIHICRPNQSLLPCCRLWYQLLYIQPKALK